MNTTLPWGAQLAIAALIGLIIGLLLMWLGLRGKNGKSRKEHEALKQEFGQYKQKVDEHFIETAAAVDELNKSYQKVVQHLSNGAHTLMDKNTLQQQLALRGDTSVTVAYLAASTTVENEETDLSPEVTTDIATSVDEPQHHAAASEAELTADTPSPDEAAINHLETQGVANNSGTAESAITAQPNPSVTETTEAPKI